MTDDPRKLYEYLSRAQRALADEIRINPDRSWSETLMPRYKAYLRKFGMKEEVAPIESWFEGSIELTEAGLRSAGFAVSDITEPA